jgi:hypothetical protein
MICLITSHDKISTIKALQDDDHTKSGAKINYVIVHFAGDELHALLWKFYRKFTLEF